ncbi:sigma-54-dependent transcriptional regulator [Pelovirga terrestris]|uniref:Sigma-54-dependent Fis family transcriptional regulator n=1 Tax=Pelovirga terrestris TaxID=2771352 RepID=A0A8J6R6C5_9BACT|nr:sigma-54 dependent transcriptional regulator [Pelovirga terrestris]MBD1401229.1 sigma-54-dependent Fis family transcriptional regulator [Pelovirga terrestris]
MTNKQLYPELPLLMVDDEPAWLHSMALSLKVSAGINNVIRCSDSREAMRLLQQQSCCLALIDLNMPYVNGEQLLTQIRESYPDIAVIIISGMNQIETAIRCVKAGAEDFYIKTDERERVVSGIMRTLKQIELQRQNRELAERLLQREEVEHPAFARFHTCSGKMHRIFSYLRAIARGYEPVLITGESGTGKELVARSLHQLRCPEKPWIAVNVAGLDDMVFSDTLFGHVKGAFTSADQARKGMIEEAADGILFLDEIGDLAPASQVKLLRLLQEGEYYPLGSDKPRRVRARILFATNQKLKDKVDQGAFRKDLYYRLCAHLIDIPPLRERKEDLPVLMTALVAEAAESFSCAPPLIQQPLLDLLTSYDFPGNVRELRAMVFDAVGRHQDGELSCARFEEVILPAQDVTPASCDLDATMARGTATIRFGPELPTIKQATQALVNEALQRTAGNQSKAAKALGITPQALNKRLKTTE